MVTFSLKIIVISVMTSTISNDVAFAYPKSHVLWFEVGPPIRNCKDIQKQGNGTSGIYTVYPYNCCPELPVQVFCDMETDGGGWTVIQRRDDIEPRENFFRTWIEYSLGFGDLRGEFWLGNDHIHALTDQKLNEIRFDLVDFSNEVRWAKYKTFYVSDRGSSYKMEVTGYSGDAGDSFSPQNGMKFSATDVDLDMADDQCVHNFKGPWWHFRCHESNLNGLYLSGNHTDFAIGINWKRWHGYHYSLKKTEMKIRPMY
ncbi:techylectin-5A-like isoform X2 [Macrobrachium rosenbergii]